MKEKAIYQKVIFVLLVFLFVLFIKADSTSASYSKNIISYGKYQYKLGKSYDKLEIFQRKKSSSWKRIYQKKMSLDGGANLNIIYEGKIYITIVEPSSGGVIYTYDIRKKKFKKILNTMCVDIIKNRYILLWNQAASGDWGAMPLAVYDLKTKQKRTLGKNCIQYKVIDNNIYFLSCPNFQYFNNFKANVYKYNPTTKSKKCISKNIVMIGEIDIMKEGVIYQKKDSKQIYVKMYNEGIYRHLKTQNIKCTLELKNYYRYLKIKDMRKAKRGYIRKAEIKNGELYIYGNIVATNGKYYGEGCFAIPLSDKCQTDMGNMGIKNFNYLYGWEKDGRFFQVIINNGKVKKIIY